MSLRSSTPSLATLFRRVVPELVIQPASRRTDAYTFTGRSWVGVVRVGDLFVELRPKIGVAPLLFILSYALDPRAWRDSAAPRQGRQPRRGLVPLLVRAAQHALRPSLLHGYRRHDDTLASIRGRVRMADQFRVRSPCAGGRGGPGGHRRATTSSRSTLLAPGSVRWRYGRAGTDMWTPHRHASGQLPNARAPPTSLSLRPDGLPHLDMPPPARFASCCLGSPVPLFRSSAAGLKAEVLANTLALRLAGEYPYHVGRRAPDSEVRSWELSLPVLANDLLDAGLDDVEVLVEHQLPLSSKRIDALLAGVHPKTGQPSYVLIELKQWGRAIAVEDDPQLCRIEAYGRRPVLHPAEQVRRYCMFLADFTRAFEHSPDAFSGAAYLHNATEYGVETLRDLPEDDYGRLYTRDRRADFLAYLQTRLAPASGAEAADLLIASKVAPSRQLLAVAAAEVRDSEQYTLLDEQQVAYRQVLRAVEKAQRADSKQVIVITGGPGSGKSVIALSLLGELWRRGASALHATGSKSFTETLRRVAGARNSRVKGLFKYFNGFMTAERNGLDVLICDEAHRVRETSANRFTSAERRSGKPQIAELLEAARVPVFLLDENQVVRPGETGTVEVIEAAAAAINLPVEHVDLDGQYRCGGSRAYEEWVLRLLGLAPGGPAQWGGDDHFQLHMADSPAELEEELRLRAADGYGARMTAGFCWKWSEPRPDGTLVPDVTIGSWSRPWNVKGDRAVDGAPPAALWATDPAGFDQVGCIYTAQGFEYDWNGVIFGPDLVWRDGHWIAQPGASKDTALRRLPEHELADLLRNVYKVLLTRGMVGTILMSTDPETHDMLRSLVDVRPLVGARD